MSLTFTDMTPEGLAFTLRARGAGGARVLKAVMEDVIEEAKEDMVNTVETTPSGLVPGKNNRVWTCNMRDTVETKPVTSGGGIVEGKWGWFSPEAYIRYQEYGKAPGRRSIPPMHALLKSVIKARQELQARLDDLVRSK